MDRGRRMEAVGSAAQHDGVAALQAKRARIRRHIGAALVYDPRRLRAASPPARSEEAIGAHEVASTRPTGSGSSRDVLDALGRSLRCGVGIEREPVEESGAKALRPGVGEIERVGDKNSADRSRKARAAAASAWFFCSPRRIGQSARRRARLGADRAHCGADVRFGLADLNGGGHGPFPKSRPRIPGGPSEGHSFRLRRPRSLLTPSAGRPCRIAGSSPDGRRRSGRYNRGPRRKPHRGRCELRRACPAG